LKSGFLNTRKIGFGIFMLIYFLSLFNNILFVHAHWNNGDLIALHAHPYKIDFGQDENKSKGSHSDEELELYDLIYNTPVLELEFFDFELNPFTQNTDSTFSTILLLDEKQFISHKDIRGPPAFS
jgi:hypothetical protein